MKILIKPIAIILINTILLAQAKIVSSSGKPVKVAYAGIKIENMESWHAQPALIYFPDRHDPS